MIYLNNAAESFYKSEAVGQAVLAAMGCAPGTERGRLPAEAGAAADECREKVAAHFGVPGGAARVVFKADTTDAVNTALFGLLGAGDHVIATSMEHNRVLRPLYALEAAGASLTILRADRRGRLDPAAFEAAFRPETKAVVLSHASGLCGNVYDVAAVGGIAHAHGALLIVDASQTAGLFPLDMQAQNIDVLCFSAARALEGPQGVGVLCVREGVEPAPRVFGAPAGDGGVFLKAESDGYDAFSHDMPSEMPARLEAGSRNTAAIAGLSAALDALDAEGMTVRREKAQALARRFFIKCYDISALRFYGAYFDFSARCPVVALNLEGIESAAAAEILARRYGVQVCAGTLNEPLAQETFGTAQQGVLRFSFSPHNTETDVDRAALALRLLTTE